MQQLVIAEQQKDGVKRKKKTRRFSAALMGYIVADMIWEGGQTSTRAIRPVYVTVAGSESSLRPFLANFKRGKRADMISSSRRSWDNGNWMQLLKTAGYEVSWQRGEEIHQVTLFIRSLFDADPGLIDPDRCQFISVIPEWWADEQAEKLRQDRELCGRILGHVRNLGLLGAGKNKLGIPSKLDEEKIIDLVPMAVHFCLCLDKRTRRPLVNDMAYCLQLYLAALQYGLASRSQSFSDWTYHSDWARSFQEHDMDRLHMCPGVVMRASHERLDQFLTEQIQVFQKAGGANHG